MQTTGMQMVLTVNIPRQVYHLPQSNNVIINLLLALCASCENDNTRSASI